MTILVTGAAGFIGYHVARRIADRGEHVIGIDNLNDYYDIGLKRRRLLQLDTFTNFTFQKLDLAERGALDDALKGERIRSVVHLAAQANVRYSLENPHAYLESNLAGHLNVLEFCRHAGGVESLVYASSSSVYGENTLVPFREDTKTDRPTSLYAATKKSQELMSAAYAHLFGIAQIGLRFFSVYGPWGRPDMAYWLFTDAILAGRPIRVFGEGQMERDFTYIDDIVTGVTAAIDAPAAGRPPEDRHRVYNIGNSRPVLILDMIQTLERLLGRQAELDLMPAQPGDMQVTYADVSAIAKDLGYRPTTLLEDGLQKFVDWYRRYHGVD